MEIRYVASPTGRLFHASDAFVRGVMGPVGSGKSVMMVMELLRRAEQQAPSPAGIRKTRWAIVRNSYRELQDTTMATFFDWISEDLGALDRTSYRFYYSRPLPDGTTVDAEFLFRALDRPEDTKKLLSLELTGAFLNEAREIRKEVFDLIQTRIGRYPSARDGGPTWQGLIADSNPMDTDHWWYRLFEEAKPAEWDYWRQPSGLSTHAENIENLPRGYYRRMMQGKSQAWIDAYVHGQYSFLATGKPVYPEYTDQVHCSDQANFDPHHGPVVLGCDWGRTPAATLSQLSPEGQWITFDEIALEDSDANELAAQISRVTHRLNHGQIELVGYGDPAGGAKNPNVTTSVFEIIRQANLPMLPAATHDDGITRQQALRNRLLRQLANGDPGFILHPRCSVLRKGLAGGYHYRKVQLSGTDRYAEKPEKDRFSHAVEALEYGMLGHGEGFSLVSAPKHMSNVKVINSARRSRNR